MSLRASIAVALALFAGCTGEEELSTTEQALGTGYQQAVSGLTPVGYWRLGEASGTAMADSSSNGLNGTYTSSGVNKGIMSPIAGETNTAIFFNGGYGSVS